MADQLVCPIVNSECCGEKCAWYIATPAGDEGCAVVAIAGSLYGLAKRR